MSQIFDCVSALGNQVSYERKEDFDINKVTIDKYDMRKNRAQSSTDKLADDIRQRGQIEYVHIAITENEYHLLASYTRYFALKQLGRKTIRAVLCKNLSEAEIHSIITGTNDFRIDPSNWDRICNIANFHTNNPDIPVRGLSKTYSGDTLCSIFGLKKSVLYYYLLAHKFISENKILKKFIDNNPDLPTPIFIGIYSVRKLIKSDDDTQKLIDIIGRDPNARIDELVNNVRLTVGSSSYGFLAKQKGTPSIIGISKEYQGYNPEMMSTNADNYIDEEKHENTQWRKAEIYLREQLEKIDGVAKVIDVSKENRGYDLEMICSNGDKYYVEAKKVPSLNEPFTMTDRERSFASNERDKYIIALIIMSDEEVKYIRYIQDPINKIDYEQVIKVVTWKSKSYDKYASSEIQFNK